MRDGGRAQRPLPVAADAQNGALGQTGLHTYSTQAARHAEAAVSFRCSQVSHFRKAFFTLDVSNQRFITQHSGSEFEINQTFQRRKRSINKEIPTKEHYKSDFHCYRKFGGKIP